MGRFKTYKSTLGGILFLLLSGLFFQGCDQQGSGQKEPETTEQGERVRGAEEATPESTAETSKLKGDPLLYCRGDKIRVRKDPSQEGEVLEVLDRNEVLVYLMEESDHRDQITVNDFDFNSPWLKVSIPRRGFKEGWVYGAFNEDHGLIEWLVQENSLMELEEAGLNLNYFNLAKQLEVDQMLALPELNYHDAGPYTGYFYQKMDEAIDGPFYLVSSTANNRDDRIVINGQFTNGTLEQVTLKKYDKSKMIQIGLTIENGECKGRAYEEYKGEKRVVKYTDYECSLDASTVDFEF